MTSSHQRATSGALFILILSGLMAFTSLSTDIYLPAMPMMAAQLHGDAELTITGFLIGFALAQLVWGPISDRLGRRTPLFIGMVLFIIGSAGCALSTTIDQIVFWRVFQALGACTGPMLARAMVRDLFARTRAAQMLSSLTIVMAIAPIAGPLIGGIVSVFVGIVTPIGGMTVGHTAFIIAGSLLILKGIDDFVLQPTLYSERVKAHPLEIFLVILIAGSMAGILGMLLAIPSYTVLRVFAKEFFSQFRLVRKLTEKI